MSIHFGIERAKKYICEQPLTRWIHADGSKLSMKDSIRIVMQLGQIAWVYRNSKKMINSKRLEFSLVPKD
ncbi:hypothetical protein MHTCC0001_07850 [Flavobacteriaceae bacterium MHTCC 0001]